MSPEELLALRPEAFKSIVNADLRNEANDEEHESLRDPLVLRYWYNTLCEIKRSMETQFATFKIERQEKMGDPDYHTWLAAKNKWRAGTLRFKVTVENRIAESKLLLIELRDETF